MAPFTQYAMAASEEALSDAGWRPESQNERDDTGVTIGSGIGAFSDVYDTSLSFASSGHKKVSPLFVPRLLINLAAGHVATRYGLRGPNHAATTACTTGAHALADAHRLIATRAASAMLAGAAEACIHPLSISGFARARSLSTAFNDCPQAASRPFDARRDGFVMAEGAAVVLLEALPHALARGAKIYAELAGTGASCDAGHMTAPLASGEGAALAMRRALAQAGAVPRDVGYVNAHATGTMLGDAAENRAIRSVLLGPGGWATAGDVNVSSTKGAVGHLLGAAGALEALFTVLSLHEGVLPPTLNLEDIGGGVDDADGEGQWGCNYVPLKAQTKDVRVAMSNSFGFGGTNASLCFRRWEGV